MVGRVITTGADWCLLVGDAGWLSPETEKVGGLFQQYASKNWTLFFLHRL